MIYTLIRVLDMECSMSFDEAYKQIKRIDGWLGPEDAEVLYRHAQRVKGTIVEIGPYAGRSTKLMALASPESQIITIDSYDKNNFPGWINPDDVVTQFMRETRDLNVTLMIAKSDEVGCNWKDEIDLLHIDGDHSYEAVKKDIDCFVPHVKSGGYVLLHDWVVFGNPERIIERKRYDTNDRRFYYDKNYGVIRAVNESRKNFSSIRTDAGFAVCKVK